MSCQEGEVMLTLHVISHGVTPTLQEECSCVNKRPVLAQLLCRSVVPILSQFSTRRFYWREATFSFVGIAFADVISDADKGKSRFARKKSPSGKRALRTFTKIGPPANCCFYCFLFFFFCFPYRQYTNHFIFRFVFSQLFT